MNNVTHMEVYVHFVITNQPQAAGELNVTAEIQET